MSFETERQRYTKYQSDDMHTGQYLLESGINFAEEVVFDNVKPGYWKLMLNGSCRLSSNTEQRKSFVVKLEIFNSNDPATIIETHRLTSTVDIEVSIDYSLSGLNGFMFEMPETADTILVVHESFSNSIRRIYGFTATILREGVLT